MTTKSPTPRPPNRASHGAQPCTGLSGRSGGQRAVFHLPDGRQLEVCIADATRVATSGDAGPTRLELLSRSGRTLSHASLSALLAPGAPERGRA
jgi:hypothetical protein